MPEEKYDLYRKLEPVSRVLRAFIPTPAEILADLGIPTIEEIVPAIKEEIRGKVRGLR